ncbi:MAG TPA: peptide-methionine (R)-S-oxide reductase MsrB [Dongiaceae bacterium]|nr:peptide-methionine (R)-S-oxide reductase MsrB [Dongiaceae bacterium]
MNDLTRRGLIFGAAALATIGVFAGVDHVASRAFVEEEPPLAPDATVDIVEFDDAGKRLGKQQVHVVRKTREEWRKILTPPQYAVTRLAGTEIPYSGRELLNEHRAGIFRCADCGTALFDGKTKFESGTGWPSFWAPIAEENVREKDDFSLGMLRREVKCVRCDAHLGHVFKDGPEPTGLRYCMNAAALKFVAQRSA